MGDTVERIADQMPRGPDYGRVEEHNRVKVRRKYRLFGLEFPEEIPIPPESLRKWLNKSPVITSWSISAQLAREISENRLEQIRKYAFPDEKECKLLSEFFGGYLPEHLFSVIFRHHMRKAQRILREHLVDIPKKNHKRWNGRVLCLVDRQTAIKNKYPMFELRVNKTVMKELLIDGVPSKEPEHG